MHSKSTNTVLLPGQGEGCHTPRQISVSIDAAELRTPPHKSLRISSTAARQSRPELTPESQQCQLHQHPLNTLSVLHAIRPVLAAVPPEGIKALLAQSTVRATTAASPMIQVQQRAAPLWRQAHAALLAGWTGSLGWAASTRATRTRSAPKLIAWLCSRATELAQQLRPLCPAPLRACWLTPQWT